MTQATPSDWPDENAEYVAASDAEWVRIVDSWGWRFRPNAGDYVKSDRCPRCGHAMTSTYDALVLLEAEGEEERTSVWCNCTAAHRGRPDGRVGCGQRGRVGPPTDRGEGA